MIALPDRLGQYCAPQQDDNYLIHPPRPLEAHHVDRSASPTGQLSLLLAVGIAGVAVGFGLLYGAYRVGKKEGAAQTPKITISNDVIVNQMRQVSQLVATTAYLTDIIEYNDTRNVLLGILRGRKKILVVARGHLNLGVDLSGVSPAIDSTRRTVSVDVPHATMLDPVLDTTLRYYDVKRSVFNRFTEQDAANIQCSVDSAFRVAGRNRRVLQQADADVK